MQKYFLHTTGRVLSKNLRFCPFLAGEEPFEWPGAAGNPPED